MRLPRLSASVDRRSTALDAAVAGSRGGLIRPMHDGRGDCPSVKTCQTSADCAGHGVCTTCDPTTLVCVA